MLDIFIWNDSPLITLKCFTFSSEKPIGIEIVITLHSLIFIFLFEKLSCVSFHTLNVSGHPLDLFCLKMSLIWQVCVACLIWNTFSYYTFTCFFSTLFPVSFRISKDTQLVSIVLPYRLAWLQAFISHLFPLYGSAQLISTVLSSNVFTLSKHSSVVSIEALLKFQLLYFSVLKFQSFYSFLLLC